MSTTIVTATTNKNKKRRADQRPTAEARMEDVASELLNKWRERLTKLLAKDGARTLGSVVDLPKLFPGWNIADVQVGMLSAEVILRLMMRVFKDDDLPMSLDVYLSLHADYDTIKQYALALSGVIPSDTMSTAAAAAAADEANVVHVDDERYSRVVLLRNIARELVPGLLEADDERHLHGEDLRSVDRAFAAWPVRYATPSCIFYYPEDEEEDVPANIDFYWDAPCDVFGHDENNTFDIYEDIDEFDLVAQDEADQALLERVNKHVA